MAPDFVYLCRYNLRAILRDRILHAVFIVALLMLVLVPTLSTFSMRQVQELAISLSLSGISFVSLIVALLLGTSSVWRDIERRYTASVLTLPISRSGYLLAKFASISLFLFFCDLVLGLGSALVVALVSAHYPSDIPVAWGLFWLALASDCCKYILLAAIAILLSSVSTSFFLPFFGSIGIYLAGSASQNVYEYVSGDFGQQLSAQFLALLKGAYWLVPNFSAFDFKVQAIYALHVDIETVLFPLGYFGLYTGLVLVLAAWAFGRRQMS